MTRFHFTVSHTSNYVNENQRHSVISTRVFGMSSASLFLAPRLWNRFWWPKGWEMVLKRVTANMMTEVGGRQNLPTRRTYLKVPCWISTNRQQLLENMKYSTLHSVQYAS